MIFYLSILLAIMCYLVVGAVWTAFMELTGFDMKVSERKWFILFWPLMIALFIILVIIMAPQELSIKLVEKYRKLKS